MRIGFDITPLCVPQSGVGTYTTSLLDELVQLQDEIIPLSHRPLTHGKAQASNGHLPYFPVNKTIWMQAILPQKIGRLGLDVCHFTNNVGAILNPCPTVITIHDMTLWLFPEYHGKRRLLSMRPIIPVAARRATAIITVSESAKQDIVRILGLPPEKVHVIYEAPAPHFKRITDQERLAAVRRQHDLPERFVLYVGTIEPRKNLVRLLEAFSRLRDKHREGWTLVMVGQRGWQDEAVFAAAERLALGNAIRFLGYVSPEMLVALYNLASVAAFPSIYEGFGLPVVEAMVCGVPVVTTSKGSLGEVAGDAAEIVEPTDVESIAAGLEHLMSDPVRRAELRERGLIRSATFSWVEAARLTREVYGLAATVLQPQPSPSFT